MHLREQWDRANIAKNLMKHKVFAMFALFHCSLRCTAAPFHYFLQCFYYILQCSLLLTKVNCSILADQRTRMVHHSPIPPMYQVIGHVCPLIYSSSPLLGSIKWHRRHCINRSLSHTSSRERYSSTSEHGVLFDLDGLARG